MIEAQLFLETLKANEISFFTGVPDSLMKSFLSKLQSEKDHVITANEGNAVALAAGYHLATGKLPLVYLQNSGLGNLVNPLTSLVNVEVYGIPMLLMIGWRGQPGKKDEPQHKKMGAVTPGLLEVLSIPYFIFSPEKSENWKVVLYTAIDTAKQSSQPVALVIEDGFFQAEKEELASGSYELAAADVLEHVYSQLTDQHIVVATTGKIGRLFYAINQRNHNRVQKLLLCPGAMGHTGSLATGLSMNTAHPVVVLDGDGALLMHLGSLAVSGSLSLQNLHYILLNNGAHQSVGGQPTVGFHIDFTAMAKACGFQKSQRIVAAAELREWSIVHEAGFMECRINTNMPDDLPRPDASFAAAKQSFMKAL